jgi:hypothetical protein
MQILIEAAKTLEDKAVIERIRREVFEREAGIPLSRLTISADAEALHLLARAEVTGDPAATLSVIDTSKDHELHQRYGLRFSSNSRVARYTQLAVLKSYRGLKIPLMLMLEAHRQFVIPRRFDYTWLLFDAERAGVTFMSKRLGFTVTEEIFEADCGQSRALVRDERAVSSKRAIEQAEEYLDQFLRRLSTAQATVTGASRGIHAAIS